MIENWESEMRMMRKEVERVIEKYKEAKEMLKEFASKDEAIEYLVKKTQLSKEECSVAYDVMMRF